MSIRNCLLAMIVLVSLPADAAPLPETNGAGQSTVTGFINQTMARWKKRNQPVLFAQCLTVDPNEDWDGRKRKQYERNVVFFPLGEKTGLYMTFAWFEGEKPETAVETDSAELSFRKSGSPRVVISYLDQGGPAESIPFQLNTEYFLHKGLTVLYPKDFSALFSSAPKESCPEWDWSAVNPDPSIEKIYKDEKW